MHTGRQALLQLLGLVIVLQHQGVEVLLASDLELDVVGLLVLLDPRGCSQVSRYNSFFSSLILSPNSRREIPLERGGCISDGCVEYVQEASFRRQISMNWRRKCQHAKILLVFLLM